MNRRSFFRKTGAVAAGIAAGPVITSTDKAAEAVPASLVLVKDGQPMATIVLAPDAPENARVAAAELQYYLEKMSGARLTVTTDAPPGPAIIVGESNLTAAIRELNIPKGRTANLREEGYVVYCDGQKLVLAGNDMEPYQGTRYAVADFLRRLGVRWFLPGDFGEVIPTRKTISFDAISVLERPEFPMRNFWEHGRDRMEEERELWKIRNRMNTRMQDWFGVPGDGSLVDFLPHAEFKNHPDWFALRKDGTRDEHMACMTSEGMIAALAARVKERAQQGKTVTSFAPEDGVPRCYCSNCMAMASAFDGYGTNDRDPWPESSTSQEWFHFVDSILKAVNQEFPDHKIATNGYSNREMPPELPDFNPKKNLVVMFANICACTIHSYNDPGCWQMLRQGEMVRQWARVCDKTWIYNYNYTMLVNKGTITPVVHRIRHTIPRLKEWGLIGFHDQDECDWSMCGIPTRVVRAELEWNTGADVEAILQDFFSKWYGPAAVPMRAYYDALESAFEMSRMHGHEDVILPAIYSSELMATLDRSIAQGEKLAPDEPEKSRVHLDRLIHTHLTAFVDLEKAKQAGHYAVASACAVRMMDAKAQMNKITPFMGWHPYPTYDMDWEKARMDKQAAKTDGPEGKLVAMLPVEAAFRTDPFDDGRYQRWQAPGMDGAAWTRIRTTGGWESQGLLDAQGHPYKGIAWYRVRVDIPKTAAGQDVHIFCPAVVNEAWVWVNGQYIGHRPYTEPWFRPQVLDLPLGDALKPGENNLITFRVLANFDVFGANGVYERPFLYARLKA